LDTLPADVTALVVFDAEGLRQGSLGRYVYEPLVVRQMDVWGGARCALLPARSARSAALAIRLADGGLGVDEVFFAAEGPTIGEVKACVDERARLQGLSSSFENIGGVRGLTDGRGLHVLAAGENVVALGFPFNDRSVLEQMARVASGTAPALSGHQAFRELLARLGGDVTIALTETGELFASYGRDLEKAVGKSIPQDACLTMLEAAAGLAVAGAQGLGELAGITQFVKNRFAGQDEICLRDAAGEVFRTFAGINSAGLALTGRVDIELALTLVFDEAAIAGEIRAVLADLVYVLQVLPDRLDTLERDWPDAHKWLQEKIDIPALRSTLRNPIFEHISVGGEPATVDLRIRVEEADVQLAVETTLHTLTRLVVKD
jgi:hypothetical protein